MTIELHQHTFGIILSRTAFKLSPPRSQISLGRGGRRNGVRTGGSRRKGEGLSRVRFAGNHDGNGSRRIVARNETRKESTLRHKPRIGARNAGRRTVSMHEDNRQERTGAVRDG